MLENASQHIAYDFEVLQELLKVPSRVYSIAACGWALKGVPTVGPTPLIAFDGSRFNG